MLDIKDKVIDYLLTGTDDICGKCIYYKEPKDLEFNCVVCKCRDGIIKYFEKNESEV